MSGPVAQYGDQEFTGAEQAVADINAKGGIKGNKLQIVKYDCTVTDKFRSLLTVSLRGGVILPYPYSLN